MVLISVFLRVKLILYSGIDGLIRAELYALFGKEAI